MKNKTNIQHSSRSDAALDERERDESKAETACEDRKWWKCIEHLTQDILSHAIVSDECPLVVISIWGESETTGL